MTDSVDGTLLGLPESQSELDVSAGLLFFVFIA